MKHIHRVILTDYLCYSVGFFLFIVLLEPFRTHDFIEANANPYNYYVVEAISFFFILMMCELVVSFLCRLPADYSHPMEYQVRRLLCLAIPCMLFNTVFDGEFFVIIRWGWEHWDYLWRDYDGNMTLQWFCRGLKEAASVGVFIAAYHLFVTYNRVQRYQIEELQSLNSQLEAEHQTKQNLALPEKVILQGEGRETIILNPSDILYIESVSNYVNIVFFSGQDLSRKRLRCSLHNIEDMLSPYSFIIHIHRAFLVNINFITQVSGNAAGYKLQLFGSDKVLPVSKANVSTFRECVFGQGEKHISI